MECVYLDLLSYQKSCLGNCSNHGSCRFVNVDSGSVVDQCSVQDYTCNAVCNCDPEYMGGDYCEIKTEDMSTKRLSRSLIINGIILLKQVEDMNLNSLTSLINSISEILRNPNEISISDVDLVLDFIIDVLDLAESVNVPYVTIEHVLNSVGSVATTISNDYSNQGNINKLENVLQLYTRIVSSEMIEGQTPIQVINSQFRLKTAILSSTVSNSSNNNSNSLSIGLPLTSYEFYINRSPSMVSLPSFEGKFLHSTLVTASLISLRSALYNSSSSVLSNPLKLRLSALPCASESSANCNILVTLQNSQTVSLFGSNITLQTLSVRCVTGVHIVVNRNCSIGHYVNMTCENGKL